MGKIGEIDQIGQLGQIDQLVKIDHTSVDLCIYMHRVEWITC